MSRRGVRSRAEGAGFRTHGRRFGEGDLLADDRNAADARTSEQPAGVGVWVGDESRAEMIDPEELSKLREEVSRAEKIWKQRRSKCREIIGVMAEGMEKRDEEIAELIGLETEEELGIPLPFRR